MCRKCGAIVGAGQEACGVCGASAINSGSAQKSRLPADRETIRFARAILSRPHKATIIFLIANIFVFLLMWQSSGLTTQALWLFPEPVLIAYGAKLNLLIKEQHQWWRFITPMFVHVGVLHLLINMYSLWIIGPYVEKLYGSAKFVVFWITTGIAGVVASYLTVVQPDRHLGSLARFILKTQDAPSAGASGALFGLVGVLFVFGIKFRHELPEGFKRAFGTGMLPVIVLNLFIGYMAHGLIDNAAHLGGLISGALLALVVGYHRPGERSRVTIWHVVQWSAIALVAVGFLKVTQHLRDPLPSSLFPQTAQATDESYDNFVAYAQAINDAQEALVGLIQGKESNGIDKSLAELDAAPHLDEKSDELKQRLKLLLEKAKALKIDGSPSQRSAQSEQRKRNELIREFDSWTKEYGQWLKTNGKKHGGLAEMEKPVPGK